MSNSIANTVTTNILPVQALYDPTTLAFQTFIGPAGLPFTSAAGGVSSVDVSGGTTGLTTSGGPIVSSGTITLAGTLSVSNGGTGATSSADAVTNILPSQTGNSGKYLTTNGTTTSWATAGAGLTVTDDTTTNATRFLTFTSASSGTITSENVASTKLTFNPSSGTLSTTTFSGALSGNATTATTATTATNLAGGTAGALAYQGSAGSTTFLTAGSNGQYLTLTAGVPTWTSLTPVSSFSAGTTGLTPSTATTGAVTLAGTLNTANGGTGNTTGTAVNVSTSVTFNNSGTGVASGTAFDGSVARTVSYNTLGASPLAGSTSLVTLGTVTAGTWNATAISAVYGGTGLTSYTTGDTVYASATNTLSKLAVGSSGQVLTVVSGVPAWSTPASGASITDDTTTATARYINFTSATTGTLSTLYTSSTKLQYLPSTGILTSTGFTGSIGSVTRSTGDFTTLSGNTVTSTTPVLSFNATNTIASFGSTTSGSYNQLVIQNKSTSAGASANYVISNDLGTDSTYYGEFGMNSSTFSASTPSDFFSINNGIYFSGHDGDISVGSGNGYKHYFVWGTTGQSAHVINASGALGLSTNLGTTPALSGTTGYGSSGQVLTSAGSSAPPTWTTPVSVSNANTFTATQTFSGSSSTFALSILDANETVNVVASAPSATTNFYVQSGGVQYYTSNAANNWTLNIAFSSGTSLNTALSTGQSVTFTLVTTQGSTAYYNNAVTIDGTSVTPKWIGGAPTAGNASGLDVYRFAVVKTASATYTVLASLTQYK